MQLPSRRVRPGNGNIGRGASLWGGNGTSFLSRRLRPGILEADVSKIPEASGDGNAGDASWMSASSVSGAWAEAWRRA